MQKLGTQVLVRQYDLTVMANIRDILVNEMIHGIDGAPLELVSTPADIDILAVKFVQVTVEVQYLYFMSFKLKDLVR